jgi:hypothetical protein
VRRVWADPSAALYVIAAALFLGAILTFLFIPKNLTAARGIEKREYGVGGKPEVPA